MVEICHDIHIVHGGWCGGTERRAGPDETACSLLLCVETSPEPERGLVRICEGIFAYSGDHQLRMTSKARGRCEQTEKLKRRKAALIRFTQERIIESAFLAYLSVGPLRPRPSPPKDPDFYYQITYSSPFLSSQSQSLQVQQFAIEIARIEHDFLHAISSLGCDL